MNKEIFVITPIGKKNSQTFNKYDAVFKTMIEPACKEVDSEFSITRADKVAKPGSFVKEILTNLRNAYIVIANLTELNPNVFYELGVRHTLSNRTIIITEDISSIPSDLKEYRAIEYSPEITGIEEFKTNLKKSISEIIKSPESPDNPVQDRLSDIIKSRESELILEIEKLKKTYNQSKLKLLSDNKETTENRVSRILKVIDYSRHLNSSIQWHWKKDETEDGKEKNEYIYQPEGNFNYYLPNDDNAEDYKIYIISIHNTEFDLHTDLSDLRVTLSEYSKFDFVDFQFIIATDIDLSDSKEKCDKFFDNAIRLAKVKNPDLFSLELWDKKRLIELEIEHGLRLDD